jgi:enoyl-CoA hydratase/carnithine racemase
MSEAASEPVVLRSEKEGVLELVLNRPAKLNALTNEMFRIVRAAVDDLRDRDELKVLLIRAKGRYFCAGVDQTQTDSAGSAKRPEGPADTRAMMRVTMGGGMHALYEEMERVEKPIVVAHHAPCVGGGLEMSLACDFRLAAKNASYSFPEMAFAMLPLSGGVSKLTRLCGPHWARWMLIANEPVPADLALTMGLVHQVYPDETFEAEVQAFCARLAAKPREAVAAGKLAIELAADLPSDQSRQLERLTYSSLAFTRDFLDMHETLKRRLEGKTPRG